MKTTTVKRSEAGNLVNLAKLQNALYILNALHGDCKEYSMNAERELLNLTLREMKSLNEKIDKLEEGLTEEDIKFLKENHIYIVPGDGGEDMIAVEPKH